MNDRVPSAFAAWWRLVACLALLSALAACGSSHSTRHAAVPRSPSRYYPPPGPASDPWGPYIREASGRFGMPEQWIRSVMRQESGGQQDVISWAGAMGLMQVMPETYAELRDRYSLGNDPFDPHNNILAGTAYLREMYDRFGSPGFLAAYNAGPNRVDKYLNTGTPLPTETVNYVASIAPRLGPSAPMTGPLSVYAGRGVELASGGFREAAPVRRRPTPVGCDTESAYDPSMPCRPLPPEMPVQVAMAPPMAPPMAPTRSALAPMPYEAAPAPMPSEAPLAPSVQSALARIETPRPRSALAPSVPAWASAPPVARYGAAPPSTRYAASPPPARYAAPAPRYAYAAPAPAASRPVVPCDPEAAFDPNRHCVYVNQPYAQVASRAPMEAMPHRPAPESVAFPSGGMTAGTSAGRWGIQVGAYPTLPSAQSAAERAREAAPDLLRMANVELPPTAPLGSRVAFRARLTGLPAHVAADACAKLSGRGMPCMTLPPERT